MREKARRFVEEAGGRGRVELVEGDITLPRLGLDAAIWARLRREVNEVFHLAALYNLAAPRRRSFEVNVEGTRRILDFCAGMRALEKLFYVSTIVVSGDRTGTIYEDDLERGQSFRNFYEETKFMAEVEVRRRAADLPVIVVRPAVVIGDSRTGEIDKYDGPYYLIDALVRLERGGRRARILGKILMAGRARAPFHLVPVDFLVETMAAIAEEPRAIGRTFQIVDPRELRVHEVRSLVARRFGLGEAPLELPTRALRMLMRVPAIERWSRTPRQALDYFDLENRYDDRNTRAVTESAGIRCPYLPEYIDTLIDFARRHREIEVQLPAR